MLLARNSRRRTLKQAQLMPLLAQVHHCLNNYPILDEVRRLVSCYQKFVSVKRR